MLIRTVSATLPDRREDSEPVPECHWHPGVETNVSCPDCERYMCPKDMVPAPVGYKCKECARPAKGQTAYIKPRQMVLGGAAALAAALLGGLVIAYSGMGFILLAVVYGVLVAEAARRGSGGHRGAVIAAIAGVAVVLGGLIGFGPDPLRIGLAVIGAVVYVSRNAL